MFFPIIISASINETLPNWHWCYELIHQLRLRGNFVELYEMNKPYTRGEVAKALISMRQGLDKDFIALTTPDHNILEKLEREFQPEMRFLKDKEIASSNLKIGTFLIGDLNRSGQENVGYKGIYRSVLSVSSGSHLTVYNGMNFDQYLVDDAGYIGKKWRGLVGYTEQAYAALNTNRFRLKFGRDFLRWGAGENGTLLFSDIARPMDQLNASAKLGPFQFTFLASVLDDMALEDSPGTATARRYISAHRLDVKLFHGRLQCAITEALVYGGINRDIEWVYLNPFIFYHGVQMNDNRIGNTLGTVDVIFYPMQKWKVYGSFLVDDIQLEKTGSGDLEPSEIGWIAGSNWADPFNISGLTINVEYAGVTNRTYQTLNSWETFIHRNVPLGHPLGNDFDRIDMSISKWFMSSVWLKLGFGYVRNGEGSLSTPFDTPWDEYTVEEGFSEPFPTGVVEKSSTVSIIARYQPSIHWGIEAELHANRYDNFEHVEGVSESKTIWRVGVWWEGEVLWNVEPWNDER